GDETRTGLEVGIVELPVALVLLKVRRVLRAQERRFVMVEPPGDLRRTGIFEIDDRVLVPSELLLIKQRPGPMQQPHELELHIIADTLAVKTGEQSRGGSTIKAFVVIKDPNSQAISFPEFRPPGWGGSQFPFMEKQIGLPPGEVSVKGGEISREGNSFCATLSNPKPLTTASRNRPDSAPDPPSREPCDPRETVEPGSKGQDVPNPVVLHNRKMDGI